MLVLFETPAGYAVFKLLDEGKLAKSDSLYEDFETIDKAKNVVKLKKFQKFEDTTEALGAATALVEGKMSKKNAGIAGNRSMMIIRQVLSTRF